MKNILDVIYEYSKKRQFLDDDAIELIIYNYMEEKDINIINTINIIHKKEFLKSGVIEKVIEKVFSKISRLLSINKNELFNSQMILGTYLDDYIDIYYTRLMYMYNSDDLIEDSIYEEKLCLYEKIFKFNLFIASIVFHELEHAHQEQVNNTEELKDLESKLIKLESFYLNNLGIKVLRKFKYDPETEEYDLNFLEEIIYNISAFIDNARYNKNYNISLLERLADIDAQESIIKVIDEIQYEIKNLYLLEKDILTSRIIRDYPDSKECPTIDFFKNIFGENVFDEIEIPDYNVNERLRLGLPIEYDEYMDFVKKIK